MQNQITVINNGVTQTVELISYYELVNTGKKYLFYTLNEKVENGLVKIYAACASNVGTNFKLEDDMTDDEWTALKMVMKTILTGGNDSNIKYLNIN